MRYNFSISNQRPYRCYIAIVIQIICWLLTGLNLFCQSLYEPKKREIIFHKPIIYPIIKVEILNFLNQLSTLEIRLLSADIYPQEIMIKGLLFKAYPFLKFLKHIHRFAHVTQNELVDWHRRPDGSWYFCLRIIFKS